MSVQTRVDSTDFSLEVASYIPKSILIITGSLLAKSKGVLPVKV